MKIVDKCIKFLGGFTNKEFNREITGNSQVKLVPVYCESLNYFIDDDSLEFEKEQLAYKIGKEMLDNNLIDFSVKKKQDNFGAKIYSIRAKACVNEVKVTLK